MKPCNEEGVVGRGVGGGNDQAKELLGGMTGAVRGIPCQQASRQAGITCRMQCGPSRRQRRCPPTLLAAFAAASASQSTPASSSAASSSAVNGAALARKVRRVRSQPSRKRPSGPVGGEGRGAQGADCGWDLTGR